MSIFTGAGVALVTPMKENLEVNYDKLDEILEWQIAEGTDAIIICGTTGESATLSEEEHANVIRFAIERVNHRIPVIAGTGSNCTATAVQLSKEASEAGAEGVLVVTPYYNKATQAGLVRHYHAIWESCPLPMIVYNVPSRTGIGMNADTLLRLSEHPLIVGIKEASGNPVLTAEILAQSQSPIHVYCGNDDQILPLMSLGACGAISVVSNVAPAQVHALTSALLTGDMRSAREKQFELLDLIQALFSQVNPIPVKAALSMMGLIHDSLRLPLTPLEEPYREKLRHALQKLNLIP